MSDVMLFGVLKMPYEMAMASELSRLQFYQRVQQLVARVEAQPEQEQWLQAVTTKIEAALLSHRLSLHNDVDDDGVGFPLVDALCCGQTSLDIGKREVEDIAEAIYHVLDANTPPALAAQPEQEPEPDELTVVYMSGVFEGRKLEREFWQQKLSEQGGTYESSAMPEVC